MGWVMKGTGERWDVRISKGMVMGVKGIGFGWEVGRKLDVMKE